jgi:hypothetical protein
MLGQTAEPPVAPAVLVAPPVLVLVTPAPPVAGDPPAFIEPATPAVPAATPPAEVPPPFGRPASAGRTPVCPEFFPLLQATAVNATGHRNDAIRRALRSMNVVMRYL